jgi:hypothetical protein
MYKEDIITELYRSHKKFVNYIRTLSADDYTYSHENLKWAPYQDLEHHKKVLKKIVLALSIPSFILKLIYGKSNNPSLSYDKTLKLYQIRVNDGAKSTKEFTPSKTLRAHLEQDCIELISTLEKLLLKVGELDEHDLDSILLPHPILGTITLREMLYFCKIHVEMHHEICKKNIRLKQLLIN